MLAPAWRPARAGWWAKHPTHCRWLHANPVSQQLAVGHVKEAFDDDGNLADDGMTARLDSLVESVLKTATMYRNM